MENLAPLAGVKVIEFARILAGPWAGQILADLGATVIKVESPAGDDTRKWGPPFIERSDGTLDAGFNSAALPAGVSPGATKADGKTCSWVSAVAMQGDKPVIGGIFASYDGNPRSRIARLNTDGSFDSDFDTGASTGANGAVSALAVDGDSGAIYVGGAFSKFDGATRNRLARLTIDGKLDAAWGPGIGPDAQISAIALAKDSANVGKVYIGGSFKKFGSSVRNRVARLGTNGLNDTSFDPAAALPGGSTATPGFNGAVASLVPQSDGNVYVGGSFTTYSGTDSLYLAKLTPTGALNADFAISPVRAVGNTVQSVATDSSDNVVVGGWFEKGVARLNSSGVFEYDVANATGFNFDTATNANGTVSAIDSSADDGSILIGGNFTKYNGESHSKVARLNSDGTPDSGFDAGTLNGPVDVIKRLASGKILIGGTFTTISRPDGNGDPVATAAAGIVQLNDDGTLDTNFNAGTGATINGSSAAATVTSIAVQADDKILVGGDFDRFKGQVKNRIVRLNSDGSIDGSFAPGTGAGATVQAISLQADGKILVGGDFVTFNGSSARRIVRLASSGARDTGFLPGTAADGPVKAIAIQADQRIIVAGYFTKFNGEPRNRIVRLSTSGALENAFDTGGTVSADFTINLVNGSTNAVLSDTTGLQPSTTYGIYTPATGGAIAKTSHVVFTTSSTVDPDSGNVSSKVTLSKAATADAVDEPVNIVLRGAGGGGIRALLIQPDSKIVAVGSFKVYDGKGGSQVVRLKKDGSRDSLFVTGAGVDGYRIDALSRQAGDGKLLIGGDFFTYNGVARNRIVRLNR